MNGFFQVGDGPLPTVFNAGNPDNADIGDSDFAWSAIDGRVDSNGNEDIDSDDCHAGLIAANRRPVERQLRLESVRVREQPEHV